VDARADSLQYRAGILRALLKAVDEPQSVARLAAQSASEEEFLAAVMAEFDLDGNQALAVADMQVRRFFGGSRVYLQADLARVLELLGEQPASG
jgi:DNA gyrase/topoisomerase IV subunit A